MNRAPGLTTRSRTAVPIIGSAHEEVAFDEDVQDRRARGVIERPQTLHLLARELKTRHLQILALNPPDKVLQAIRRHLTAFRL